MRLDSSRLVELSTLRVAAELLATAPSPEQAIESILDQVIQGLRASSGAIFLRDGPSEVRLLTVKGRAGQSELEILEEIALGTAPTRGSELVGKSRQAAIAAALSLGKRSLGSLVLMRDSEDPFGEEEVVVTELVAAQLALALDRADLERTLQGRIDELHLSQRQMEAYALDLRETFAAEKERAEQLARALTELEQTYLSTVQGLAVAVEAKDAYTAGHIVRVTKYGLMMMAQIAPGKSTDPMYEHGFLLHDIGKLSVPDAVLGKAGPLTDEEWKIMRLHSETGRRILEGIPFLAGAKEIVFAHHERWDGKGYPRGLEGEEIPLGARVFPIADSFDAMTSDRPYRKAMSIGAALEEIRAGSATQFWPEAVEAFLSIPINELEEVRSGSTTWDPLRRA